MSAWAKPGVKCVCVDAYADRYRHLPVVWRDDDGFALSQDQTYTIREVILHPAAGVLCIKLSGVDDRSAFDFGYALSRFRPLVTATKTQEQDVQMILSLLAPEQVSA